MTSTSRPARLAGRVLIAALLFLNGTLVSAVAETTDELLQHADEIKTANNSAFADILKQLETLSNGLTPAQRDYYDYLKGWQAGYRGDYQTGESTLKALLDRTNDPVLAARTRISLINDQALASHYPEAYANLSELLDSLPRIKDQKARNFSYGVASLLYNQAGQYDLALKYADLWLADSSDNTASCKAMTQKVEALYKLGKLHDSDPLISTGIDACQRIGDPLFANGMRYWPAQVEIDQGRAAEALQLLKTHDDEILATHAAAAISIFRASLARASLLTGDLARAKEYAQSSIDYGIKRAFSKPVTEAYQVLYEVAKQQGDYQNALAYHEKYAEADKGYLNDTTARTLAYQMVNQQMRDKKREIDALNEKNQRLQLQGEVDAKSAEATRLYILLLVLGLASIVFFAYRTKLSQLKFMKLARRDGLTGIFNRQHFLDAAEAALRYGAKSSREACVVLIDLDHFKQVNDVYGHAAGDLVLKQAVRTCQSRLRSIDIFGRLGGEEFGIVLPDAALDAAQGIAEDLRAAIAGLTGSDARIDFPVSASFGVTSTKTSGYEMRELLADADAALYAAKHAGRNCVKTHQAAARDTVSA